MNRTENAMAPHSSTLAWKIPWMEEPGRLQSMGVVKSWTRLSNFTFTFHFNALEKEMATCGEQAPPMAKVMRKEARHTQRRDRASGVPLEIFEHLPPKPESAYFLLCSFTYTSDFMGSYPPLPLSEKKS